MDEEQQGFRRNRGVDDVLQISRRLTEEICSSRGPTHVHLTLYDIEKAYPRINRQALWTLLKRRGVPEAFVKLCQGLHDFTQVHIRVEGITSRDYTADRGLKEGCPVLPPAVQCLSSSCPHGLSAPKKTECGSIRSSARHRMESFCGR